jgi:hypothetical protein
VFDFSFRVLGGLDLGLEGVQEASVSRGTLCEFADRGEEGGLDSREVAWQLAQVALA